MQKQVLVVARSMLHVDGLSFLRQSAALPLHEYSKQVAVFYLPLILVVSVLDRRRNFHIAGPDSGGRVSLSWSYVGSEEDDRGR